MTNRDQRNRRLERQICTFEEDVAALIAAAEHASASSARYRDDPASISRLRLRRQREHQPAMELVRRRA